MTKRLPWSPCCIGFDQSWEIPIPGEPAYSVLLEACPKHGQRILDILRLATAIYELRGTVGFGEELE